MQLVVEPYFVVIFCCHDQGNINSSKKICPNYKCAPNQVLVAKKSLSEAVKAKLREYDFGIFLDLKLRSIENTKLLMFLMHR